MTEHVSYMEPAAPRGQPGPVDHRGAGVRTPRGGRRRDRLVHPPGRPRRDARGAGARAPRTRTSTRSASSRPDVVIANHEENRELDVRRLRESGHPGRGDPDRDRARGGRDLRAPLRRRARLGAAGLAGRGAGAVVRAAARRHERPWRSRSGGTRGWWSAGRRSPATWPGGWAGPTRSPTATDRYPKVEPGRDRGGRAWTWCCSPTSPTSSPPRTAPRRSRRTETRLVSGRLLTWYGPSLLEADALLG